MQSKSIHLKTPLRPKFRQRRLPLRQRNRVNLQLETNPRYCLDIQLQLPSGAILMITGAPMTDCWLFRVSVTENLALLAVPQFGGVDIRLLSATASYASAACETNAARIMSIFHKRSASSVPKRRWLEAIKMLQAAVRKWRCGTDSPI